MRYDSITFPLTATTNRLERYTNTMGVFGTVILVTLPIVCKKVFQNTNNRKLFLVEVIIINQDRSVVKHIVSA